MEHKSMGVFNAEIDGFLISKGFRGEGRGMALRGKDRSGVIEWRCRCEGPNGLILLLCLMKPVPRHFRSHW